MSALLAAGGLLMAACGGASSTAGDPSTVPTGSATTAAQPQPSDRGETPASSTPTRATAPDAGSPLPAVEVLDVATGDSVQFADFLPADRALLFWFWAPH